MKKKILSLLMATVLAISCFTVSFNAYGKIYPIILGSDIQGEINGEDDLVWFSYTPEASGTYSFLSYSTPATEAYLFIKEINPETNTKQYVQLAYSNSDPNYAENGHNSRQFCLTYHLEAGVKYFFAAGWYLSESRTSGSIKVKLRCDSYDVAIDRIEVECPVTLDAFTDGSWNTDTDGNSYFFYNIGRIVSNTTVTLYYPDGTSSSATGQETIDGFTISYNHNQSKVHWYPKLNENYTENTLTVKVLDKTAKIDVEIISPARFSATGIVTDMIGNPVENAEIIYSNSTISTTDKNGKFTVTSSPGVYSCTIRANNAVDRKVSLAISSAMNMDYSDTPIAICTCDYLDDEIVNAKDYAVMTKTLDKEEFEKQQEQFKKSINFTANSYPSLSLE